MPEEDPLKRLVELMELQIVLDLHARGMNQDVVARMLKRRKAWVNALVQDVPKGRNS
jgi:transcriptional regulator